MAAWRSRRESAPEKESCTWCVGGGGGCVVVGLGSRALVNSGGARAGAAGPGRLARKLAGPRGARVRSRRDVWKPLESVGRARGSETHAGPTGV